MLQFIKVIFDRETSFYHLIKSRQLECYFHDSFLYIRSKIRTQMPANTQP